MGVSLTFGAAFPIDHQELHVGYFNNDKFLGSWQIEFLELFFKIDLFHLRSFLKSASQQT